MTSDFNTDNGILLYLTSQQTDAVITTTPPVSWGTETARSTRFFLYVNADTFNLSTGHIKLGTPTFPLGFYDISIFQNSSPTNFSSFGLNLLYTGLVNAIANDAAASPTYKEYGAPSVAPILTGTQRVYLTLE